MSRTWPPATDFQPPPDSSLQVRAKHALDWYLQVGLLGVQSSESAFKDYSLILEGRSWRINCVTNGQRVWFDGTRPEEKALLSAFSLDHGDQGERVYCVEFLTIFRAMFTDAGHDQRPTTYDWKVMIQCDGHDEVWFNRIATAEKSYADPAHARMGSIGLDQLDMHCKPVFPQPRKADTNDVAYTISNSKYCIR